METAMHVSMTKNELKTIIKDEFQAYDLKLDQRFKAYDLKLEQKFKDYDLTLDQRFRDLDQKFATKEDFKRLEKQMIENFENSKSYTGVLYEDLSHKLDLVLESLGVKTDRIDDHEKRICKIEGEIPVLKLALLK